MRLIIGLLKGLIIGAGIGFGAYKLGLDGGFHWLTYILIGAVVGLFVGRPVWAHLLDKKSTVVISVLKAIVGSVVAAGIYALVAKVWGGMDIEIAALEPGARNLYDWQFLLGGAIGALYGAWVEVDDAPAKASAEKSD